MLLAGRTPSNFQGFAGISSALNAAAVQSTCGTTGHNTARRGMAVCKSVASVAAMNRFLFIVATVLSLTLSAMAQVSPPINGECPPAKYKNVNGNCVERPRPQNDRGLAIAICRDGEICEITLLRMANRQ